eukprot:s4190_g6.t1
MITPPGVACCVVYDICEDTALFADSDAEDNDPAEDDYELAVRAVQWSGPKGAAQPGRPGRGPRPRNRERAREPDHPGHRACEKWEPGWTVILCYEFWLKDSEGKAFCIKEVCVVGRVKMPLLAVGKLFRHGWSLVHTEQGLSLEEPRGRHHTPVIFKRNSLAVVGSIRAITEMPRTLPPRVPRVTLTEEMQRLVGKEGMHVLADGTKFHCTRRASHLLDARPWYDINFFKARTTLFQSVSGQWLQVENSADYINEPNPFTLASSQPKPRITMISSTPFSVEFFAEGGIPPKPSETLVRSQRWQHRGRLQKAGQNPQNTKENPQNTEQNPQNTKENPQNTEENPQNAKENHMSPKTPVTTGVVVDVRLASIAPVGRLSSGLG